MMIWELRLDLTVSSLIHVVGNQDHICFNGRIFLQDLIPLPQTLFSQQKCLQDLQASVRPEDKQ